MDDNNKYIAEFDIDRREIVDKSWFMNVFSRLGVNESHDLLVHSGLLNLRVRIENDAHDVNNAILESIGTKGTVIMPSHSGHLTDPHDWTDPPVPKEDIPAIIEGMEAFDPKTTKIRNRGVLAEKLFLDPRIKRSCHPLNSVIALGPKADYFTSTHPLHESEGYGSPAWKFYKSGGYVLLIGVDIPSSCTFIHLGEYLNDLDYLKHKRKKVLVIENGEKKFIPLNKYPVTGRLFSKLHPILENEGLMKIIRINKSFLYFFPFKEAIDITMDMIKENPDVFNG